MQTATTMIAAAVLATQTFASDVAVQEQLQNLTVGGHADARELTGFVCTLPPNGVSGWTYDVDKKWYDVCNSTKDGIWAMLNAYRAKGTINVHWRYVTDPAKIDDCLQNWEYYDETGQNRNPKGPFKSPTTENDPNPWCPLKVYQTGGVKGKQWAYCDECPQPFLNANP